MTSQNLFSQTGQGCQQPRPHGAFPWLWRWGTRFKEKSILDLKTHLKKTETFQYTHFTSCHPPSVKKGFVKGEALRILRTNSSKTTFEENISNFKKRLIDRGYPQTTIENLLSDIKLTERESALLKHNNKEEKEILPFVTQYQPPVSTLKEVLMKKYPGPRDFS